MATTPTGRVSGYAFLLVFPGFVIYQTLVDAGAFPPLLGGFFTAACVAPLPFVVFEYVRSVTRFGVAPGPVGPLFFLFLVLFGVTIAGGIASGADAEITGSHAAYLVKFIALFLIARMMNPWDPRFRRLALTTFALIGIATLWRMLDGNLLAVELARQINEEFQLDYQGVAHAFMVLTLFCLPSLAKSRRAMVYALAVPSMFIIGGRSELAAFILAGGVIEFCKARSRPLFVAGAVGTLASLALLAWLAIDALPDHRVFSLLQLSADQSAQERAAFTTIAWRTIQAHPIVGDYASYDSGTYAHNILSAWVDLGLTGFLLVTLLLLIPVAGLLRRFGRDGRQDDYVLVAACVATAALLILFAKTYNYQLLPLMLGLYSRRVLLTSRFRLRLRLL